MWQSEPPPTPPPWADDLRQLERWLLGFLVLWVGGGAVLLAGAMVEVVALQALGGVVFFVSVVPYVGSIIFAFKTQDSLYRSGAYPHEAWQVAVGGLILNPWVLGVIIPSSVWVTANRLGRAWEADPGQFEGRRQARA